MDNKKAPRSAADVHEPVKEIPQGESMTRQADKEAADINNITDRYLRTGMTGNRQSGRQPMFADFTSLPSMDLQEMRNTLAAVEVAFDSLPARVRRKFKDDPYRLLLFIEDERNREDAIEMGLIPKLEPEVPKVDPNQTALSLKADPEANPNFVKAVEKPPEVKK